MVYRMCNYTHDHAKVMYSYGYWKTGSAAFELSSMRFVQRGLKQFLAPNGTNIAEHTYFIRGSRSSTNRTGVMLV